MKIVLITTTLLCGFASLFVCLEGDVGFGVYFFLCACLSGFALWLSVKEDPTDPCIPANWQLEEVTTARLESYLNQTWHHLHDEWGYEPTAMVSYNDGLRAGFAMAIHQIASTFKIDLEKP